MASLPNKAFLRPGCMEIRFFSIGKLQLVKYRRISAWNGLELCVVFLHTYFIASSSTKSKMGPHIGLDLGLNSNNLLLSHSIFNFLYLLVVFQYKLILYHLHTSSVRYLGLDRSVMSVCWPREAHLYAWFTKNRVWGLIFGWAFFSNRAQEMVKYVSKQCSMCVLTKNKCSDC